MKNLSIISFSVIIEGNQTGGTSLIFQAGPSVPETLSVQNWDSEYDYEQLTYKIFNNSMTVIETVSFFNKTQKTFNSKLK